MIYLSSSSTGGNVRGRPKKNPLMSSPEPWLLFPASRARPKNTERKTRQLTDQRVGNAYLRAEYGPIDDPIYYSNHEHSSRERPVYQAHGRRGRGRNITTQPLDSCEHADQNRSISGNNEGDESIYDTASCLHSWSQSITVDNS